ncbi:MAG: methylated-DNA--[protein]-cysteine S-methyltransferase [Mariprofundaceae bacterium]
MIYRFDSPYGTISYAWNDDQCSHIWLRKHENGEKQHHDPISQWLARYFAGEDITKTNIAPMLRPANTTFQSAVREALLNTTFGSILTYGELAKNMGTSPRAMGQALGANPLPVIVPCHRVVAAAGLGGFSCGIHWKKNLLQFESNPSPKYQ